MDDLYLIHYQQKIAKVDSKKIIRNFSLNAA